MSNALAIGSVTAVFKNLLENGLIEKDPEGALGAVSVSTLPPDRILLDHLPEAPQLNLFLYQVTPNQGWSNMGLPSRAGTGELLTNPPLALDLHYLLTVYGTENLGAEILLGYAMQVLHETPMLSRSAIRTALSGNGSGPVSGAVLPQALQTLSAAELADQFETLKITPQVMNTEEISSCGPRYKHITGLQWCTKCRSFLSKAKRPPGPLCLCAAATFTPCRCRSRGLAR